MEGVVATRGRSGLEVAADGEVSVNREVTMTAMARDEEGNMFLKVSRARSRQVVGQVSGIFAISGSEEESAPRESAPRESAPWESAPWQSAPWVSTPSHHSFTMPDCCDCRCHDCIEINPSYWTAKQVCICIFSIIFGSVPVAMVVFGILDYNLCPGHTRLAIYMIAQGATSVLIPILASCWYCCKCVPGKFIFAICVIIGLFNIAWGIVGTVWLVSSPCQDTRLFTYASYFSAPMWIFYCLVLLASLCHEVYSRCTRVGDD